MDFIDCFLLRYLWKFPKQPQTSTLYCKDKSSKSEWNHLKFVEILKNKNLNLTIDSLWTLSAQKVKKQSSILKFLEWIALSPTSKTIFNSSESNLHHPNSCKFNVNVSTNRRYSVKEQCCLRRCISNPPASTIDSSTLSGRCSTLTTPAVEDKASVGQILSGRFSFMIR